MYNIIGKRKYFYIFSGTLMVASIIALSAWGLCYGIDFTGGTLAEFQISNFKFQIDEAKSTLSENGINDAIITPTQNNSVLIRYGNSDDEKNKAALARLKEKYPDIQNIRIDYIGP